MRQASASLVSLLNSSTQFIMADLWTFTLQGGAQFLLSGGQTAITDQPTSRVFALGPRIERSTIRIVIGLQSDELEVRVYPATTDMLGAISWEQAAWQGQLDGATVQLERAFMGASGGGWGDTSAGTVVLFLGRVSDLAVSRTVLDIRVRSHLELLNIEMPRRLWQPSCTFNFGDTMCGYDRVNGKNARGLSTGIGQITFSAAAGSTTNTIYGVPSTTNPYVLGTIIGLTGANAGQKRTIYNFSAGGSSTSNYAGAKLPFLSPPVVGDSFQILPGCARNLAACFKFAQSPTDGAGNFNSGMQVANRFGGMPFVPPAENAV